MFEQYVFPFNLQHAGSYKVAEIMHLELLFLIMKTSFSLHLLRVADNKFSLISFLSVISLYMNNSIAISLTFRLDCSH